MTPDEGGQPGYRVTGLARPRRPWPLTRASTHPWRRPAAGCVRAWLRTTGVNTNGAAARVMNLTDWEKGTPWHYWEDKNRLTGVPKRSLCQKHEICSDPVSADPICPFPNARRARCAQARTGACARARMCASANAGKDRVRARTAAYGHDLV